MVIVSLIRLRTNLYNFNDNMNDEVILSNNIIRYRATIQFFRLGPHVEEVNLSTSKVVV